MKQVVYKWVGVICFGVEFKALEALLSPEDVCVVYGSSGSAIYQ